MVWHYREAGAGRPLILLHGIGMSHAAWHPVFPLLSATRRVIAFDVAGFGESKPLPRGTPPTLSNLVDSLVSSMRELDLLREGSRRRDAVPAHTRWVVGHGWGHVPMWVDPRRGVAIDP